jgi:hypothetical protein
LSRHAILGAISGLKQCVACHGCAGGDLLGAFTYTLRRMPSAPPVEGDPGSSIVTAGIKRP